jgi:DNA-directed RNA polymerase specialized sigma subunit
MNDLSDLEQQIYSTWLKNDEKFKETSRELGKTPEYIRQVVARVKTKLSKSDSIP